MIHTISRDGKDITLTKEEVRDIVEAYLYNTSSRRILEPAISALGRVSELAKGFLRDYDRHLEELPLYLELQGRGLAFSRDPVLYECILVEQAAMSLFKVCRTNLVDRNYIMECIDKIISSRISQINCTLNLSERDLHAELLHEKAMGRGEQR